MELNANGLIYHKKEVIGSWKETYKGYEAHIYANNYIIEGWTKKGFIEVIKEAVKRV